MGRRDAVGAVTDGRAGADREARQDGPDAVVWALLGIVVLGALLRIPGLDRESFWLDETIAANAGTRGSLFDAIDFQTHVEVNPPLYHSLLWVWIKLFGDGEAAIRLLSALAGIATIPVVFAIGRRLHSARAGLLAALLTATSPLLVHYSQEARPYALTALFGTLSVLFLLRVLDEPTRRSLVLWTLVSAAALATSYFAGFLLVAEVAWLLWTRRGELRPLLPAVGAIALVGIALLPLAGFQRRPEGPNVDFISSVALGDRLRDVLHQFIKGVVAAPGAGLGVLAGIAVLVGWVLLVRSEPAERRTAALPLALGLGGLGLVVVFDRIGFPVLLYRYLLLFWVPLAVALGIGLASHRAGRLGLVVGLGLAAVWVLINIGMFSDEGYHRSDWRSALAPLDPARADRVVAISPGYVDHVLFYYGRSGPDVGPAGTHAREFAIVGAFAEDDPRFDLDNLPLRLPGAPAFRLVEHKRYRELVRVRYRASRSARIGPGLIPGIGTSAAARLLRQVASDEAPEPLGR